MLGDAYGFNSHRSSVLTYVAIVAFVIGSTASCRLESQSDDGSSTTGTNSATASEGVVQVEPTPVPTSAFEVTLDRVIDGDSLELADQTQTLEVRLVGINAPELRNLDDQSHCPGQQVKQSVEQLLGSATTLQLLTETTDRFGRSLGELWADGVSVNDLVVARGLALSTGDDSNQRRLMKEAADARRGIWGDICGRNTAQLIIDDANPNPPGRDEDAMADEWVRIKNDGATVVDLNGWVIRDETTSNHFGLDGQLQPGSTLTVRSGDGHSDEENLYLAHNEPVWSNSDETVILVDPNGVYIDWYFID